MKTAGMFLTIVLAASFARADVVHLKDGSTLEGDIQRQGNIYRITQADGTVREIHADQVATVQFQAREQTDKDLAQQLESLRNSTVNAPDTAQPIEKYNEFILAHKGTPIADEAGKDLLVWLDRRDRHLIRVGTGWLTAEQRDALLKQCNLTAASARQLVRDGRIKEAETQIKLVLSLDPRHVTALYLDGLIQFAADQVTASRKSFETINTILPDHAPTLNNLAVIAWRQKQYANAMALYDRAMTNAPGSMEILNNVDEALTALAPDQRKGVYAMRAAKHFNDLDTALQAQVKSRGLVRYGGAYLSTTQMNQIAGKQKELKEKLDALAADYTATEDKIKKIDLDGDANDRSMRQIEASSNYRNADGNLVHTPYPPVYAQLQRDNDNLKAQRVQEAQHLTELQDQAKKLNDQMPKPIFTGVQHMIGEGGAPSPVMPTSRPTTQSTTQPATQP